MICGPARGYLLALLGEVRPGQGRAGLEYPREWGVVTSGHDSALPCPARPAPSPPGTLYTSFLVFPRVCPAIISVLPAQLSLRFKHGDAVQYGGRAGGAGN